MNVIKTLRRINIKSFWQLILLGLKNPLFIYPTFIATKHCLIIATKHYGRLHYKNTAANAFRHAFWNYLIAKKCAKWSKTNSKILNWTKNITDWHENAFKNRPLPKKMDLHNNAVGRFVFKKYTKCSLEEVIQILIKMTATSIKVSKDTILKKHQFSLVHISD